MKTSELNNIALSNLWSRGLVTRYDSRPWRWKMDDGYYLWTSAPTRTMMAITTRTLTTPPTCVIRVIVILDFGIWKCGKYQSQKTVDLYTKSYWFPKINNKAIEMRSSVSLTTPLDPAASRSTLGCAWALHIVVILLFVLYGPCTLCIFSLFVL